MKRLDLLQQVIDNALPRHDRIAGNVVDRLFWIKFGALAARFWQNVNQVAFYVEQTQFEDSEEPGRPGADDDDVGLDCFIHALLRKSSRCAKRSRALVLSPSPPSA